MEWKPEEDLGRLGLAGIYREIFRVLRALARPRRLLSRRFLPRRLLPRPPRQGLGRLLPLRGRLLPRHPRPLVGLHRHLSVHRRLLLLRREQPQRRRPRPPICRCPRGLRQPPQDHPRRRHPHPLRLQRRHRGRLARAPAAPCSGGVEESGPLLPVALLLGGATHLGGMVYIGVVCHLAVVMSLLEDVQGFRAIRKIRALLAGRFRTAAAIFAKLDGCFLAVEMAFRALVVDDKTGLGVAFRVAAGLALVAALFAVVAVALVAQAIVCLVCKSYHRESIDKAHLAYVGEYEPIVDNGGVQMVQITGTATA